MDRPGRKEQVFILPKSVEVGKSHCCRFSILMSAEMERNAETWGQHWSTGYANGYNKSEENQYVRTPDLAR